MTIGFIGIAGAILLLFLAMLGLYFHKKQRGLRVLMYHRTDPVRADALTVTTAQLHAQLTHLKQAGYQLISLPDLLDLLRQRQPPPARAVLLTFDDAYLNTLTHARPVLAQFGITATIFVPTAFVGGRNDWDGGTDQLLTADQLRALARSGWSLAYHSHRHLNYKHHPTDAITQDMTENMAAAREFGLPMLPALAYPFGGRPKQKAARRAMEAILQAAGIELGFRIGNRINGWPFANCYALNRIDVRGTDSLATFRRKLRWGKML